MFCSRRVAYEYLSALKYLRSASPHWRPEVRLCSSLEGEGVGEVWQVMAEFRQEIQPGFTLIGRDPSRLCSDWLNYDGLA